MFEFTSLDASLAKTRRVISLEIDRLITWFLERANGTC